MAFGPLFQQQQIFFRGFGFILQRGNRVEIQLNQILCNTLTKTKRSLHFHPKWYLHITRYRIPGVICTWYTCGMIPGYVIQGSPSGCGRLQIPGVPQVEKVEHHHRQASRHIYSEYRCILVPGTLYDRMSFDDVRLKLQTVRGNKCDHDCMFSLVDIVDTHLTQKHRVCHKGQCFERWCCCIAVVVIVLSLIHI